MRLSVLAAVVASPLVANAIPMLTRWDPAYYVGALYNMNQGEDQNEIIVSAITLNGNVEYATSYPTGGKGGGKRGPDPLHAQDSILVEDGYIFLVNALSNSVSMFSIDQTDPTSLTQVGENVYSGGDYPVTVAVSPNKKLACVLNSGINTSLQCFKVSPSGLSTLNDTYFSLQENTDQTNPPMEPGGGSDIQFNWAGTQMYASLKGPGTPGGAFNGEVVAFGVDGYSVKKIGSYTPPGTPKEFSLTLFPYSDHVLMTDPSNLGIDVFAFDKNGSVAYSQAVAIPGQDISDPASGNVFVLSGDAMNLQVDPAVFYIGSYQNQSASAVILDLAIASFKQDTDYMYVLGAADQVIRAFSLSKTAPLQWIMDYPIGQIFNATGGSAGLSMEGMATYILPQWAKMGKPDHSV